MAADLFALTSREDPCPFVNLEAMESGLAVVAFQGSGGAPEVLKEAGACVPHLDVPSMASAVRDLLNDPAKRAAMGKQGQAKIRQNFTWDRFMEDFKGVLRADFGYHPAVPLKVSVIVPNYRHERFLEQRLRSIFNQTVQPHEIIFLDNASPDDSVQVARRLSLESPVPMKIIVNEQNNGSVFKQWLKGLSLATGDLVWIAEADDACRPQLLERLVPEFYDPEVALAYCQSAIIGPDGEMLADQFYDHTNDLSLDRWRSPFSVPGHEEVELALSQKNSIPNASAVVFRRPASPPDFADDLENLRFAGDWLFYAMQLREGKISYVPEILNLFRRHPQTNTHQVVRDDSHVEETLSVKAKVFETFSVSMNAIAMSLGRSVVEYNDHTREFNLKRPVLTDNPTAQPALKRIREVLGQRRNDGRRGELKILVVASDLGRSDEVPVSIRLANALSSDHHVFLCNTRPWVCDASLVAEINNEVVFLEGTLGQFPCSWTADPPAAESLSGQLSRCDALRELIRIHQIDVIHSLTEAADRLVLDIKKDLEIPWFAHFGGSLGSSPERVGVSGSSILLRVLQSAIGLFYERESDVSELRKLTHQSETRFIRLPAALDIDSISSICAEVYAEAYRLQRRKESESMLSISREKSSWSTRQSA
jgi:glycosyltransferase involved in cell wall biosynthesis